MPVHDGLCPSACVGGRFWLGTRVLLLFSFVGIIPVLVHYVAAGPLGTGLAYDAGEVWLPIARQLSNGRVLYVTTIPDNKTPLFHGLTYLVY